MVSAKPIALAVSVLLVAAVSIGLIVGVRNRDKSSSNSDVLSTTSKAVATICGKTTYQEACVNSLNPLANNQTATPKDYLELAINAAIEAVKSASDISAVIGKDVKDPPQLKMGIDDCKELLQYATDELQAAFSQVGDPKLHTREDRLYDLKNWLSATISYQQSCLDGIARQDLHDEMNKGMVNASQLTSNVLAIVDSFSTLFKDLNIQTDDLVKTLGEGQRSLLESGSGGGDDDDDSDSIQDQVAAATTEQDDDERRGGSSTSSNDNNGYPGWMPAGDRKLLGVNGAGNLKPNAIVAQDGSGQFKTITDAVNSYPRGFKGRFVIYVKAGVYKEYVLIDKDKQNIFMYGDGPKKTLVAGDRSFTSGWSTYQTATFAVIGNGFICKSMGFQNQAGPDGHQAVALRVQSDMSAFYNVRVDGYQDSLYAQTHKQFYRNCVISGTVDFIFGDSTTVIQNSLIIVRRPNNGQKNAVLAQGRSDPKQITGLVLHNCRIVPELKLYADRFKIPTYLGRPWKAYAQQIVMESTLGDFIHPAGWLAWSGDQYLNTATMAEYMNRGPGADLKRREKWGAVKVFDRATALKFTAGPFLQGQTWIPATGTKYMLGLRR